MGVDQHSIGPICAYPLSEMMEPSKTDPQRSSRVLVVLLQIFAAGVHASNHLRLYLVERVVIIRRFSLDPSTQRHRDTPHGGLIVAIAQLIVEVRLNSF